MEATGALVGGAVGTNVGDLEGLTVAAVGLNDGCAVRWMVG